MSVIKIENLTFSYYGYVNPIFEEVTFYFDTSWKTGLTELENQLCSDYFWERRSIKGK